jgi:hypothetical protein
MVCGSRVLLPRVPQIKGYIMAVSWLMLLYQL